MEAWYNHLLLSIIIMKFGRYRAGQITFIIIIMKGLTSVLKYCVSLNSLIHANGRSRNMIIHHGLMGSSKNFRGISKNIAISGFVNTHLIDSRNHGDSPHTATHTIEDLADDLYEYILAHQLNNKDERLTLMGHSMGGLALMQFTKKYAHPHIQEFIDRVIIIDISPSPLKIKKSYKATGNMLSKLSQIDMHQTQKQIFGKVEEVAITPQIAALMKSQIHQNGDIFEWQSNIKLLSQQYNHIGDYCLAKDNKKQWHKPVEMIYGSISNYHSQAELEELLIYYPQMTKQNLHSIQGAGHWVHFDRTRPFLETVKKILEKDQ